MNGHFLISLDFELVWGGAGWNLSKIELYKPNLSCAKEALCEIVHLLEKYDMKCTIGYVGAMNYASLQELQMVNNTLIPSYLDISYASFASLLPHVGKELDVNLFLAHREVEILQVKANVELASHTYSHYYCLEEGQTIEDFENDVRMAKENAIKQGVNLVSIIFPRNQVNDDYLTICRKYGFTHFRGMLNSFLYKPSKTPFRYSPMGALRFLDTYLNISGNNTYTIEDTKNKELIDVPGQGLAQGQGPAVGQGTHQPLPLLGDDPAHQPRPHREGKALRSAAAAGHVQQPPPLGGGLPWPGLRRRGPVWPHLHRADEIAPLLLWPEIALRRELGIGVFHRDHRRLQMPGQGPLRRQLLPGGQPPGQDILFDAAVEIVIPGQAPPAL